MRQLYVGGGTVILYDVNGIIAKQLRSEEVEDIDQILEFDDSDDGIEDWNFYVNYAIQMFLNS